MNILDSLSSLASLSAIMAVAQALPRQKMHRRPSSDANLQAQIPHSRYPRPNWISATLSLPCGFSTTETSALGRMAKSMKVKPVKYLLTPKIEDARGDGRQSHRQCWCDRN